MHRFFVDKEQIGEEYIEITGNDVNHIKNVLRMKNGETVLISDGEDREYECQIDGFGNDIVLAKIIDVNGPERELSIKVTLFQGLPKGDKMETIIQKMVELGAYKIVPTAMKRSIMKLDEKKAANKHKRWNAISESAAKQSKRGIIPEVTMPVTYKQALQQAKDLDMIIVPYENADGITRTRQVFDQIKGEMNVGIFIGPEGGFAPEEIEEALAIGAYDVTLGKRILRTETAGMCVMSILMFQNEE